jgi:hypothetical protein
MRQCVANGTEGVVKHCCLVREPEIWSTITQLLWSSLTDVINKLVMDLSGQSA